MHHEVCSYLILDHDTDRGIKVAAQGNQFKDKSHVLLSLAAMSTRFHVLVESFSLRHLTKYDDHYEFYTNAELEEEAANRVKEASYSLRRSTRLVVAKTREDARVYRTELVKFLRRDVEMIAQLVHGDITTHLKEKREKLAERETRRLRKLNVDLKTLHVELKIRYHTDRLAYALKDGNEENPRYHQKMLDEFGDPQWDGELPTDMHFRGGYGGYEDVHDRVCDIDQCEGCAMDALRWREERYWG
ncbi:hypothetical protein LTR08_009206 [Meristemomyces frigidus]|nr:hypothetical protein LTR08_009206 [Meristemomyces frigidus]